MKTRRYLFRALRRTMYSSVVVWVLILAGMVFGIDRAGAPAQAQAADVIIVLGSGLRRNGEPGDALYRRSIWAAEAYAKGLAPVVICTGGQAENQRRSEASACAEVLVGRGVPADAIVLEDSSRSTQQNAIYTRDIMAVNGWRDAVLITDSFHMLRASWIFDSEGVPHHDYPVPREWVRDRFYWQHLAREVLALHWQAFIEIFDLPFTDFVL
jgi:uncharacterized SAM-binding protein YcdF (DUF218 family)